MATATQPLTASQTSATSNTQGRMLLWSGVLVAILGIAAYLLLFSSGKIHHIPWYAPILATIGLLLVFLSLRRRFGIWRLPALILVGGLAGFEWWFLLYYAKLPEYSSPVALGDHFPQFTALLANGSPFSQNNLSGDKDTVLVFFRGHW